MMRRSRHRRSSAQSIVRNVAPTVRATLLVRDEIAMAAPDPRFASFRIEMSSSTRTPGERHQIQTLRQHRESSPPPLELGHRAWRKWTRKGPGAGSPSGRPAGSSSSLARLVYPPSAPTVELETEPRASSPIRPPRTSAPIRPPRTSSPIREQQPARPRVPRRNHPPYVPNPVQTSSKNQPRIGRVGTRIIERAD